MRNCPTLDSAWMNMVRGVAICAVVIHHWLLFIPHGGSISLVNTAADVIQALGGTAVHLFFILSGCGLTISYFKKEPFSWKRWAWRRFRRIVVPYWVVITCVFVLANLTNSVLPQLIKSGYSGLSLLTYLTFTRNFYGPSWGMNPTLWFMPVIIGLYVLFPLLIRVLKKYGSMSLVTISLLVTYGSITACILLGYPVTHQTALFPFYVIEFSLGILIGYALCFHPNRFRRLVSIKMCCLGIFLYGISWATQRYWTLGNSYNDLLTAMGLYLVMLYACRWMILFSPQTSVKVLNQLSKVSYGMYLIHGPLILFLVKPLLDHLTKSPIDSFVMIILGVVYCATIFMLARILSRPISSFASRSLKTAYSP